MKIGELWNILYRLVKNEQDRGKLYHYLKGIGNAENLQTTNKNTLVEAINEVNSNELALEEDVDDLKTTIEENEEIIAKSLCDLNNRINPQFVEITYNKLKELRDNAQLIAGTQYRITDYQCTTVQENTRSAGHQFDIIVVADNKSTLNENARAILHNNDTYFADRNINAWEIKYCLDNDTTRFLWADSVNGKGVIYYMKDEWCNECPYDFKNIQFQRKITNGQLDIESGINTWVYTFNAYDANNALIIDATLLNTAQMDDAGCHCKNNIIKEYNFEFDSITFSCIRLNNNVFLNKFFIIDESYFECYGNTFGFDCNDNTFGTNCHNIAFGNNCNNNTFGNHCRNITFGNSCGENTFGSHCLSNLFMDDCSYNIFGDYCYNNSFGSNCNYNKFASTSNGIAGNYFRDNVVENSVSHIILYNTATASPAQEVKNYHIKSSVYNQTIEATRNLAYITTVANNSSGQLKTYCEADLVN